MMGALAAGCAFGTAGTAAAHAIQYPVGALTHTPHGLGRRDHDALCDELQPPVAPRRDGRDRPTRSASTVPAADDDELADAAIDEVTPAVRGDRHHADARRARPAGDKLDWTAEQALGIDRLIKNNPRPLDLAAMRAPGARRL